VKEKALYRMDSSIAELLGEEQIFLFFSKQRSLVEEIHCTEGPAVLFVFPGMPKIC